MAKRRSEPEFQHPDMGDMSAVEYARWLEEHDQESLWSEPVEVEIPSGLASVVSVRFGKGELDLINAAAEEAGLKLSTFIRHVVMSHVTLPNAGVTVALALMREQAGITAAADTLSKVAGHLRAVPSAGTAKTRRVA